MPSLSHRDQKRTWPSRVAVLGLVPTLLLVGCTGGDTAAPVGSATGSSPSTAHPDGSSRPDDSPQPDNTPLSIDYAESPSAAAVRLGAAIAKAADLDTLRPLAREALARTGVATISAQGDRLASPGPRTAGLPLLAAQVDNLALDYLEGQGWTLAEFTRAIAEHPQGPGAALLERPAAMGRWLREWVKAADAAPDDPEAFAPLLLAGLAKARGGAADFTVGSIQPDAVVLTYLELAVLTAGSLASSQGEPVGQVQPSASPVGLAAPAGSFVVPAALHADDKGPCAALEKLWGKEGQDFAEEGSGALFDKGMDKARDWLTGRGEDALAAGMKLTGNVLKTANFLTTLIAMYGGYSLTVKWDPAAPHYLGYDGGHGDPKLTVTAEVSTRPQADDATLACLKFLGVEKPDSEAVKETTVEWKPLRGTPKHATVTSKDLTRMPVSESGSAVLELAMTAEKSTEAGRTGKLKKDQIVIQAELTTYKATPSKIAAAALFGGVFGGNLEVAKGWLANWFPKKAVATIPVEWHQLPVWRGVVERPDTTRWVFLSGQGAKSIWTVTVEGGPIQAGPTNFKVSGKSSFDLTSGSASATLVREAKATMMGYPITMLTQLPMTIELTGTDEAPTLTVNNKGGSNVVTTGGRSSVRGVEPGGTEVVTLTEMESE